VRPAALALVLLLVASCGYSAGQVSSGDGRTIAVPLFRNQTYRRDLERDLTRAVHQELVARTDFHLIDEGADPDLVVRGKLLEVSEDVLSQKSRGRIRETSVIVTVLITVEDRRTGEKPVNKLRMTERQAFVPEKDETVRTAEIAAMRGLAERIVYTLSAPW
jgi:outer membrane lipopolysaccharide assembly protein LptE/RlpB